MYEEAAEQNARELISQCGRVLEVCLKTNGQIEVVFEKGVVGTLGSIFKFGYSGTGPMCFAVWLQAAGFSVTTDAVACMKAPKTLRPEGVSDAEVDAARKSASQAAGAAEEAEAKRQAKLEAAVVLLYSLTTPEDEARKRQEAKAEEQRRANIQAERKSAAQCVMCGRALTFFQKLFGKDRHGTCATFIDTPSAPTVTQRATVASPVAKQSGMVLFLFNSDTPPADTDTSYGAFSESKLLTHLFARWNQDTGQDISKTDIKACHGDLFEHHPLGKGACTLKKLGKMMQDNNLDGSRLRAEFDSALRKGTAVGFIPWAVGLFPVPDSVVQSVHQALKHELPEFYLGVIALPPSCQFEATASNLALPQTMRIQKGQLVGDWQGKAP